MLQTKRRVQYKQNWASAPVFAPTAKIHIEGAWRDDTIFFLFQRVSTWLEEFVNLREILKCDIKWTEKGCKI